MSISTEPNDDKTTGLQKHMTISNCISYLISIIIGSGIFIVPNGILRDSGSVGVAFLVWIFGGVFSIFGAISYAELGCLIPKTGGEYIYLRTAFPKVFGFLFVWSYTFIYNPAVGAFAALLFSDYALKSFFPSCQSPSEVRTILAAIAIMIICLVNCMSIKLGQILGYVFNIGKIIGLLMIIGFGVYGLYKGRVESFMNPFENSSTDVTKLAIAFNAGCFSYGGWNCLNNLVGEMKNPNRTFPVSIFTGLAGVVAIYLTINVAYLTLLSPKEMIESNAVAFTFAEKLIGSYSWIISIFVCLSALGFINGILVSASRQIYAAANSDDMPSVLGLISIKYRTPITSVIFSGIVAVVYLAIKDMDILLNISMLLVYIWCIACTIALLYLRKTQPDVPRPFRVPLIFPIIFLVICFFLAGMICIIYTKEFLLCTIFIIIGLPVYYICTKEKPAEIQQKINKFTIWMQKLTLSVIDTKAE